MSSISTLTIVTNICKIDDNSNAISYMNNIINNVINITMIIVYIVKKKASLKNAFDLLHLLFRLIVHGWNELGLGAISDGLGRCD